MTLGEKEKEENGYESPLTFKSKRSFPSFLESIKELRRTKITWYREKIKTKGE